MIDGDVKEFVDNLYYGTEMYFIFQGRKYFVQGWYKEPFHHLVLTYDDDINFVHGYIFEHCSQDSAECVKAFLDAKLWGGKTFYEVEKEMIWTD